VVVVTINENLRSFAGRPVEEWRPGHPPDDPTAVALRVKVDLWGDVDGKASDLLLPALDDAITLLGSRLPALIIGAWGIMHENDAAPVVAWLAANAERLPALEALFIGDLMVEESEISWIEQTNITPLLQAYPQLGTLGVRGGTGLRLTPVEHENLHTLVVETGGLPGSVVRAITASSLPALRHLELWLGDDTYGNTVGLADLRPILDGCFDLRVLGLRNAVNEDDVAEAVAGSAVLDRLDVLDLSLGNLTDRGAEALLASARVLGLTRLDLHHHYLSRAMMDRLLTLPVAVDVSDRQEPDQHRDGLVSRPIAVSE
jgi:hypothetical protein